MKINTVLLLLFAVIGTVSSQCSPATVRMQRTDQGGNEGESINVNFMLDCVLTDEDFTLSFAYSNKGTTANSDYDTSTTVIDIPSGVMFFGTSLELSSDPTVEEDEEFCVVLTGVGGGGSGSDSVALTTVASELSTTVTIINDDTATVAINPSSLSHTEGDTDTTATLTLLLSNPLQDAGFTQVLSYMPGTAGTPSDYTPGSSTVTLQTGATSTEVLITITGDTIIEDDEIFTVSLGMASAPTGFVNPNAITTHSTSISSEITIVDDDTLTVNFVSCGNQNEGTNNVEFVVSYTPSVETTGYSFSFSIDSGAATTAESDDYTPYGDLSSSPINIPTGETLDTFTLTYIEDMKVEDDEEIVFILTSVAGPGATTVGATSTITCTIIDDDDAMLSIEASNSIAEDAGTLTTTLLLSKELEDPGYSATMTVIHGTTESADYSTLSTSFEIPTCVSTFEYLLDITNDDVVENCESFTISLSSIDVPTGFRIDTLSIDTSQDESIATISVDETATVGIVDILTYTEGAGLSFSVVLSSTVLGYEDSGYSATITILQGTTEGTGSDGDYSSNLESVLIPMDGSDATISIGLIDNSKFEDFETFTASLINVSPPSGFKMEIIEIDTTQNPKEGVIADDDSVSLSFSSSSATVGEGTTNTVTICLDNCFEDGTYTLSLDYSGDLTSAGNFIDYSSDLTVNIPADTTKVSFTVTVSGDNWVEDTETLDIALSTVSFPPGFSRMDGIGSMSPSIFTLTVTDDDTASIAVASSSFTVTEQDSTDVTVTVTYSTDNIILIPDYSVALSWIPDTATEAANDYTAGDPSVSISTGSLMQTFEFVVESNLIVEDHESLTVSLASIIAPSSLTRSDPAVVISTNPADRSSVITIQDQDTATLCFQDLPSVTEGMNYFYTFETDLEIEDQFTVSVSFGSASSKSYSNVDGTALVPLNSNPEMFSTSLSLTLIADDNVEDIETFSVTLDTVSEPAGYNRNAGEAVVVGSGTCSVVVTEIHDDDTVTISMDLVNSQLDEGNTEYLLVDIEGGQLCVDGVSLTISYHDRTTTSSDYSGTTTVIAIPTSTSQVGWTIPTDDDDIVEDNESFEVILVDVNQGSGTMRSDVAIITSVAPDQTTLVTIMDDDSATLSVSRDNECFNEDDPITGITLVLDKQLQDSGFTFDLVYGDITAQASSDYFTMDTDGDIQTLTTTFTFSVTLSDDMIVEGDQSFTLSLISVSHPSGYDRTDAIFLDSTDRTVTMTIKDDDTATLSVNSSKITVGEEDSTAEVILCLSNTIENPSGFSVSLTYDTKTANDETSTSIDYTSGPAMLMLPQHPIDKLTATMTIVNDNVVEDDESFCLTMSDVTDPLTDHLIIATGKESTTVCITEDDTATVSILPPTISHTEDDTDTTITVTLQWSAPLQDAGFTQVLSYIDGTTTPSDYTPVSMTVTLPTDPVMSIEVPITIVGDTIVEDDEVFTVSLGLASEPTSYVNTDAITTDSTMVTSEVTIVNDDTLTVNFVSCGSHDEGTDDVELVVSYTPALTMTGFSFSFSIDAGTTTAESADYTPSADLASSPVAIETSTNLQTFSLTYIQDMKVEDDEEIVYVITGVDGPVGASVVGPTATITCSISDDDDAMLSIEASNSIAEDAGTLTTTLFLSKQVEDNGYSGTITVIDGTTETGDYTTLSTSFDIPICVSSFEYLLDINDDEDVENCESFTISLSSIDTPSGFRIDTLSIDTSQDESIATISVDEIATIGIKDILTYTEGNAASLTLVLTSTVPTGGFQEGGYSATIEILPGSTEGTGAGGDYISDLETVALPMFDGDTTISIGLIDNLKYEDFETYTASLVGVSPPTGFKTEIIEIDTVKNMQTGVIADDDSVSLSFSSSSTTISEGSQTTVTICLDNPFEDGIFTLDLDFSGDLASSGTFIDYSSDLTVNIPADTTKVSFTVTVSGDDLVEDTETLDISLSSLTPPTGYLRSGGTSFTSPSIFSITVNDDDTATLAPSSTSECFNEDDPTTVITLLLDKQIQDPGFTFDLVYGDITAEAPSDYSTTDTQGNIPTMTTALTYSVTVTDDMIVEGDQSFTLSLTSVNYPSGYGRTDAIFLHPTDVIVTITIKDEDTATLSVSTSKITVEEGDPSAEVVLCLSHTLEDQDGFSVEITYDPKTANDETSANSDYTAGTAMLQLPQDPTDKLTATVSLNGDNVVEDDESFCLTMSGVTDPLAGHVIIATGQETTAVCITDDDIATVSILPAIISHTEDETNTEVTVTLQWTVPLQDEGFTQVLSYIDGTAMSSDYTPVSVTVTLPTDPAMSIEVPITILGDTIVENDEVFTVSLGLASEPTGYVNTDAITTDSTMVTSEVTIVNDDTLTVNFVSCGSHDEGEDDVELVVSYTPALTTSGFSFSFSIDPGSTTAESADYTANGDLASSPVAIETSTTLQTFSLTYIQDMKVEDDEEIVYVLTGVDGPVGASVVGPTATITCSILDDDNAMLSIEASNSIDEDVGTLTTTLFLSNQVEDPGYSGTVTLLHGTTESADFTTLSTSFDIPTCVSSFEYLLDIDDDEEVEDCESFTISLSSVNLPAGFRIDALSIDTSQDESTATISVDETATVGIEDILTYTEGNSASLSLVLTSTVPTGGFQENGYSATISILQGSTEGTGSGGDYSSDMVTVQLPLSGGETTISIALIDNLKYEDFETYTASLIGVSPPTGFKTEIIEINADHNMKTGVIADDDSLSLSFGSTSVTSGEESTTTISICLDNPFEDGTFTLNLDYSGDLASSGTYIDYSGEMTVDIPADTTKVSFTVTVSGDNLVEDTETVNIALSSLVPPTGYTRTDGRSFASPSTLSMTVTNDDSATCSFVTSEICVNEDIGTFCSEVSCDTEIEDPGVSFLVSYMGGTAVEPDDFTTLSNLFEFETFATSLSFCGLLIEDDEDFEAFEYLTVDVIDVQFTGEVMDTNAVVFQGTQTVTIKSNDTETFMTTERLETTQGSTPGADVTTAADNVETTMGGVSGITTQGQNTPEDTTIEGFTGEGTTAEGTTEEGSTQEAAQQDQEIGDRAFGEDPCVVNNSCSGENMVCVSSNGVAKCNCAPGFEMQEDDYEGCRDTDECLENPCKENQFCINLNGSYECICHGGFQMIDEGYCEDINECSTNQHNCMMFKATLCKNTLGNFTCPCIDGHVKTSSGNCVPVHLCDPTKKSKCQFPEDLCNVDQNGEDFCACSVGFSRSTVSSACENINECLEIPNVCQAIEHSYCVDDVPTRSSPDDFYHCDCMEGYAEISVGRCVKEVVFRILTVLIAINGNEGISFWSEDLVTKESQIFRDTSGLLCSFLEGTVLGHPGINRTECSGLGFSPDGSYLKVAIRLAFAPATESVTADVVREILVTSSRQSDTNILLWETENGDSITVQESSLDVKALDDITCPVSLCKNGGTCILDRTLYQTLCRCHGNYTGPYCETQAGEGQETLDTSVSSNEAANVSIGLFIGLGFASLVFLLVAFGVCMFLIKAQRASKIVSSKFEMRKERPLFTPVPNIVRNPRTLEKPLSSHLSKEVDYDDIRLRRLHQSFMRMGGSGRTENVNPDDFEDNDGRGFPSLFTVPYETDGSINV